MNLTKNTLRKEILNIRKNISKKDYLDKLLLDKLINECNNFSKICVYINYGTEVNTTEFITTMLKDQKEIFVPVCNINDCTMQISKIDNLNSLKKNAYGILEPESIVYNGESLDAIILPGAVFDVFGNRIGYGKGYYDKFISSLNYNPLKIGVCYDFQLLNSIPAENHDIKMDVIISENRRIKID